MRFSLMRPVIWRYTAAAAFIVLMFGCASTPSSTSAANAEAVRLHALFDEWWEEAMKREPEAATYFGDDRYGDQLSDASPEAEARKYASDRKMLARAQAVRRDALPPKDRVSLDMFIYQLRDSLTFEPLVGFRRMTLGAIGGFHSDLSSLLAQSPVDTVHHVEQMIARMAAYPRRVDQELVRLRQGKSLGWVPPRAVLERVIANIDAQLVDDDNNPFLLPFRAMDRAIPEAQQRQLRERAAQALRKQVLPAQRRLRDFVAGEYRSASPPSGALLHYPDGASVYAAAVRQQTTTELTPAQIHEIGLREVARLRGDIDRVMREMAWKGDFASFVKHLNTDPKYFHKNGAELLASHRDVAKRIDAELPRLFAELPRLPYGIRPMPSHFGPDRAEYYEGPALDGSRPGWFNANAEGFRTRPIWGEETLTAHEAVPGHHLQIARAQELGELPKFRRTAWFTAYGEGWALYAETLGFDLGLYKTPESRFGHYQDQLFRAARLVVDTGIHAQGWDRQRAIDYMVERTGSDRKFIESEVDRYTSVPGQALGYMLGELKIMELRERAKTKLNDRFDLRRFHNAILDQSAVPLPVLETLMDEWMASQASR